MDMKLPTITGVSHKSDQYSTSSNYNIQMLSEARYLLTLTWELKGLRE